MPSVTLKDENGKELLSSDLSGGGLSRYVKTAVSLRSLTNIRDTLARPLSDADGTRELGLTLDGEVPIGGGALSLTAGASASIGLHNAGTQIFAGSDLQAPETVPPGTAYASLSLGALLKAGVSGDAGRIGFGFEAGGAIRYAYFQPFDTVSQSVRIDAAVKQLLKQTVFPGDAEDLVALPVGAFVSLAGQGEVSFSGEATLSSSATLLATPGLKVIGSASVNAGASATLGVDWTASGEFELRVSKPAATTVRLSFFRRRGRSLNVSATATAGVSATLRGRELLSMLMRALSKDPEADLLALVNAGLDDAAIEAMQQAIAASIDRSLTLSAQLQVSRLRDDQALFTYEIDPARVDAAAKEALKEALHGRLSAIGKAAAIPGGAIRLVSSAEQQLRERKTTWRINLLGILNVASFVELVREGTLTFDPISGALNAADRVSSKRIRVKSTPLASDPEKLRKVLFESLLVTAVYQASRVLGASMTLTADHMYVEQHGRTRRADLEDHYRALTALGLCDAAERDARLGGETEFGNSIFVVENHFDTAACDTMFLDADGEPHDKRHYERIGREAFLALLPEADSMRSFRRVALKTDAMWDRVRELGGALERALPSHIRHDARRLAIARGDVVTIIWWANAMSGAARELVAVRKALGQKDAATLFEDPTFRKARERFAEALERIVATTESRFDDPWDLLAMDAAAARLGRLNSTIITKHFAAAYTETDALPAAAAPASRSMRASAPASARAAEAERPFTPEELEVFGKHVINLRKGRLSSEGSFASSPEQVTRIFNEHIPAYIGQLGSARRPRVLLFAHGGLVEEREGLLGVLARRRFWEMNGVYPVYFVWETGLRETLRDFVGLAAPARRERGALTDAAIETLARNGGKQVWGQMKKSAEQASARDGGGRLVAELAASLWKSTGGEMEFHAVGHSAGAILHAFFLPVLVGQKVAGSPALSVQSLQLLAPAITTQLFKSQLVPLVGRGKPITRLAEYTMTDEVEQKDSSLKPYGKSLLYLVSNAFEDAAPNFPLAGLQRSLNGDLPLIRFFGLAGTQKVADIVFSPSDDAAPLTARSRSNRHGGFDNDVPTMTSVIRRVLDVPDSEAVTDYFEEAIAGVDRAAVGMPARDASDTGVSRSIASRAPAVRAARAKKPWTVMVWMAGDNDLESFGDKDLAEMKRVGSTDDLNVVVQFDSMRDDRTRRYEVKRGGSADADVVQELGETNTGDPRVAVDFFRWAIQEYPAERLLGVIWNHGSGIDDTDIYRRRASAIGRGLAANGNGNGNGNGNDNVMGDSSTVRRVLSSRHRRALFGTTIAQAANDRAIAFDDTSRDFLDNAELKKVLADVKRQTGRTLDVLGFDACLMNMVEVAYQMRGTAKVVVGSEELEPGEGWPYDRVLELIAGRPTITGAELGTNIVRAYVDSYRSGSVTQSALDLGRVDDAAAAVDGLAKALTKAIKDAGEYTAVAKTLNATQRFDTADFVDLGHFCQELSKRSKSVAVKSAAKAALDVVGVRGGFVLAEAHKGASVKNASGAAIYFPRGPVNKAYAKLDFAKATGWRAFLDAYHKA